MASNDPWLRIFLSPGLARDNLENDFMKEFSGRECHIMIQPRADPSELTCCGRGCHLATGLSTSAVCLLLRSRVVEIVSLAAERAGTRRPDLRARDCA